MHLLIFAPETLWITQQKPPQLLDHLASELVMHRRLASSVRTRSITSRPYLATT